MPPLILAKRKIAKRRDTGLWPSWTARAAHDRSEGDLWIPPPPTPLSPSHALNSKCVSAFCEGCPGWPGGVANRKIKQPGQGCHSEPKKQNAAQAAAAGAANLPL